METVRRLTTFFSDRLPGLLDFVFPPSCLACDGRPVTACGIFCAACAMTVDEVPPVVEMPENGPLRRLHSPLAYGGALAEAVIRCKHAGMPAFARALAGFAARRALLPPVDLVLPVPLHRARLARRGYNQAALIARAVSRILGAPWSPSLLLRVKDTSSQGGLTRAGRFENLKGAFAVPGPARRRIAGRRVLLVDDVWTTGATCHACARALLGAGAAQVTAFTVCRVAR